MWYGFRFSNMATPIIPPMTEQPKMTIAPTIPVIAKNAPALRFSPCIRETISMYSPCSAYEDRSHLRLPRRRGQPRRLHPV
jgi:hypothetical protein